MKIYNTILDKYGYPIDHYNFLCDGLGSPSGWKWSIRFEMNVWNFIAQIINFVKRVRE